MHRSQQPKLLLNHPVIPISLQQVLTVYCHRPRAIRCPVADLAGLALWSLLLLIAVNSAIALAAEHDWPGNGALGLINRVSLQLTQLSIELLQ